MRRLFQHIVVYAAVNAFVVIVWTLIGGGSVDKLQRVMKEPADIVALNFWPAWVILAWGVFLVTHAGFALSNLSLGSSKQQRRRQRAMKQAAEGAKEVTKEIVGAIDKAHERRMKRKEHRASRDVERASRQPGPERRWVAVMFCDIADSTSHNERLGDDEWHRVLGQIRTVVRFALAQRGGSEVGTSGDGMLARFESPADAVLCGIDVQSELGGARETSGFVPEVRIGIHAGDAVSDDGDLVGRVINLASRVTDEAGPGEILVTEPVADELVGSLVLEDKGLRPLKGLSQPRHLLAVKWSGVQT